MKEDEEKEEGRGVGGRDWKRIYIGAEGEWWEKSKKGEEMRGWKEEVGAEGEEMKQVERRQNKILSIT